MRTNPVFCKILLIASCLLAIAMPTKASQVHAIEFNSHTYHIGGDTVLLDREGIFGCTDALTDPVEAFEKVNALGGNAVLLVAPSVYWLDDPDDPEVRTDKGGTPYALRLRCDTLSLIGLAENPEDVVFAVNRGQTQGAVGNYTMFHFLGKSLSISNITFGNYCNTDLDYPRNPKHNRKRRKDAIVQAQIGICDGTERLFAQNCRFISRLNLCPFVGARRSLYDNCYFECTDDALSGSGVYLDCRFTFFSSKPFYSTAETGAVFLNCDITCLGKGVQYFTKVPGQVVAIDTRFHCDNPIEIKWTRDHSDIICRQENITLNGKPYTIDSDRPELGPSLEGTNLRSAYKIDHEGKTIYNLPNLVNGPDAWDPKDLNATIAGIESTVGKKLTGLPVALRINVDKPEPLSDGSKVEIESTPLLWGGYPAGQTKKIDFVAKNSLPKEKEVVIPVATEDGLSARATLKVAPKLRRAPTLKRTPQIKYDADSGSFIVDYSLSGKRDDDSMIMWGRVMSGDDRRKVYLMQEGNAPTGRYFKAGAGDLGYEIVAIVMPKFKDSFTGAMEASPLFAVTDPEHTSGFPESSLSTDFSGISIVERESGIPGLWSFDVFKPADTSHVDWIPADGPGWYFGKGFDASTGKGLVQREKGARMSYVPARDVCRDMTVSLVAEPAKSGGQGFGSATTQYMDICVKFDPIDLDGYALRIERTPEHDRAVSFSLIRYDKGKTYEISEKVISDCYRNPCHITVGVTDGILKATAYTDAPAAERKCCDEVVDKVMLSVPVEANDLCGFCLQHTGSTGPSSTLLRDLDINWK